MTGLHSLLERSAAAGLALQREDGSLPPGDDGPYASRETPLRNTGHWLVTFSAVYRLSGDERLREAALAASRYLAGEKARPGGGAFLHREHAARDACNGLVGQAWTVEALCEAAETFDAPHLAELAEAVFLMHPFDPDRGLWQRIDLEGQTLGWDLTFNHQLWFAAAAARLAPLAGCAVGAQLARFLDRLPRSLALRSSGRIRHYVAPRAMGLGEARLAGRLLRIGLRRDPALAHKEAGYHAFNLHALAQLRRHAPDHAFWRGHAFARLWDYALGEVHLRAVARNGFGWPYNPTGIEMAVALDTFEGPAARGKAETWLAEQLRRHWDPAAGLLCRDTSDPNTLAARLYEAAHLPDLALPERG